jgi:hypothetical protein
VHAITKYCQYVTNDLKVCGEMWEVNRMLSFFCKNYYLDFKKWVKSLKIRVKFFCWLWFFGF